MKLALVINPNIEAPDIMANALLEDGVAHVFMHHMHNTDASSDGQTQYWASQAKSNSSRSLMKTVEELSAKGRASSYHDNDEHTGFCFQVRPPYSRGPSLWSTITIVPRYRGSVHPVYSEEEGQHRPFNLVRTDPQISVGPIKISPTRPEKEEAIENFRRVRIGQFNLMDNIEYPFRGNRPRQLKEGTRKLKRAVTAHILKGKLAVDEKFFKDGPNGESSPSDYPPIQVAMEDLYMPATRFPFCSGQQQIPRGFRSDPPHGVKNEKWRNDMAVGFDDTKYLYHDEVKRVVHEIGAVPSLVGSGFPYALKVKNRRLHVLDICKEENLWKIDCPKLKASMPTLQDNDICKALDCGIGKLDQPKAVFT
ncbi:hypothetical protein FQN50_001090 [Emmonsiellopsis sp. PD_5]|nr:hypothetical protein FQN50_001090 [Emmonsiellopsis sp. PD_5]